jgi:four helix bundle protein
MMIPLPPFEKLTMSFKFEKLDVWMRGIDFANEMFNIADNLPQQYQFSLGEQLRRASLSVPTNVAEGCGRDKEKEKKYFYRIAKGSIYEVISLLVLIGKRGFLGRDAYKIWHKEADEIAAILTALSRE